MNSFNSVFQDELAAINFSAGWALERNVKIKVFSDSKSYIEAIRSPKVKYNFVLSIKDNVYNAKDLVSLVCVNAHAGNPDNDLADHFAKIASCCGADMSIPAPYLYLLHIRKKRVCKEFLMNEWNSYWKNSNTGKLTKEILPLDLLISNKYVLYLLTNHRPFPAYLCRFKILNNPDCLCGEHGDVDHCLTSFEKLRKQYYELPETTDISKEDEALYKLEERVETLKVRFKVILEDFISKREKTMKDNNENECSKSVKIKLPKIPLPIFDGKYEEWSRVENQFLNLIANNDDLSDSEKLYYLRSSLNGEAKQVETEDDTFDSFFKALKERFKNKKLIINAHVNEVINYEKTQHASAKALRCLLDNIRKNLRALKVLEYERYKLSDIILLNILLPKLDRELRKLFESSLETLDVPKLDNFLNFLEKSPVLESINRDQGVKVTINAALPLRRYHSFLTNSKISSPRRQKCYLCKC
ncbi:hypothetical protein AVEN_255299-1 [Araneus ventricosus]|uniref:Uncharacterized protein n=1 Tax=Araneus ventricosus TaxID=182803 RepID=A0A4Y2BAE7_ARAVE|nr:hypothetical protein AVEN_255299-1 [Araneus ventricosus]